MSSKVQGVRVQVSADERLPTSETRNLKPGTRNRTPDPRLSLVSDLVGERK
jgi:hypothetical protein